MSVFNYLKGHAGRSNDKSNVNWLLGDSGLSLSRPPTTPAMERWTFSERLPDSARSMLQTNPELAGMTELLHMPTPWGETSHAVWVLARARHDLFSVLVLGSRYASLGHLEEGESFAKHQAERHCCLASLLLIQPCDVNDDFSGFVGFAKARGIEEPSRDRLYNFPILEQPLVEQDNTLFFGWLKD
jgi:hypothetical protein